MKKLVSVFGPSECRAGDPLYEDAVLLGRELARRHFVVVTGAYEGVMEAAAKGAREAGGGVVGVSAEVYFARGREINAYITKEVKVKSAIDQLMELIDLADAYIAIGNNPGTMLEVSAAWDLMKKGFISKKPLMLVGSAWKDFYKLYRDQQYFESSNEYVSYFETPLAAADGLEALLGKQLNLPELSVIKNDN